MTDIRQNLLDALRRLQGALPDWASASPQVILGVLVALTIVLLGAAFLLVARSRREAAIARRRAGSQLDADGFGDQSRVTESLQSVGKAVSSGSFSRSLEIKMMRAGFQSASAPAVFLGSKVLLLTLGISLFGLCALVLSLPLQSGLFLTAFGGLVFFLIPNLYVAMRRDARRKEVQRRLPDAVDLLEICVSSGMGLDMAWKAVAEEVRRVSTIFADEMELTRLEINLGVPRATAMRHLADRTGSQDISSLVALIIQAERFGASIVDALRTFASTMREVQSKRAEESAEKMSVKLLFPMVLFIFPTLLIVMVGPAVMNIIQVMT
jgi:tight adherence protein C